MKRRDINLPLSSLIIREYSLLLSLLYFFALSNPKLEVVLGVLCCFGILTMILPVITDDEYPINYKALVLCMLLIATMLIIYGLFFSANYVHLNDIISIVGLCFACGGALVAGGVSLFLVKKERSADNEKEITQRFFDITHILMLYVVILVNL